MKEHYKRVLRTLQTYAPPMVEFKFAAQAFVRGAFRYPHERDFEALRLLAIDDREDFVDIGANRGQSIQSIRLFRPQARIVAFEPNRSIYSVLNAKFGSDPRLRLINAAVGRATGLATLHIPVYRGFPFDGLASLRTVLN